MSFAAAPDLSSLGLEPPVSPTQVGGLRPPEPVSAPTPPPAPAQPVAPGPEPVVEVHAAPSAAPSAAPIAAPVAAQVQVQVRLATGERISVGSFPSQDAAKAKARQMTRELEESRVWPFLAGRYIRPDAIVSIDLDLTAF